MALLHATEASKQVIDLSGPDGNAFVLLGLAQRLGRQLKMDPREVNELLQDMKSGSYHDLVESFNIAFGDYVDLILPDNWSANDK